MMRYLKLVNFEVNRFSKVYFSLLAITLVSQMIGVLVISKGFLNGAYEIMQEEKITAKAFVETNGGIDFTFVTGSLWFLGPIALCAVTLILYIFLIWYRDWFGKNPFIYRLFMLPAARGSIYLSKATAIFLMVLGMIAIQLMIIPLQNRLFNSIVPEEFLNLKMNIFSILKSMELLNLIIPSSFMEFLINYGIGLMVMSVLFTAILFERSYHLKGIAFGVVYGVAAGALFVSPLIAEAFEIIYLYPKELFGLLISLGIVVIGISLWVGNWLLNKRVTV